MKIKFGERIKLSNPDRFKVSMLEDEISKEIAIKGSYNFWIEPVEAIDKATIEAVIEIAKERGIDEVMLLNKPAILSALEKQIPKKPKVVKYDIGGNDYFCLCGEKIKSGFQYCPECGQALDWSDTE